MSSLTAFTKLDSKLQDSLLERVISRKARFLALTKQDKFQRSILIVGDKPAPSAPTDPAFHYTPFGALEHSSLWINLQLTKASIDEAKLSWINAADLAGIGTSYKVLEHNWMAIICLGGSAAKWIRSYHGTLIPKVYQVHHPAAWKRFNSKAEYPLIPLLVQLMQP